MLKCQYPMMNNKATTDKQTSKHTYRELIFFLFPLKCDFQLKSCPSYTKDKPVMNINTTFIHFSTIKRTLKVK